MFREEKLSQAGQKNNVLVQKLFTQTHLTVSNIKKLHKRAGKSYILTEYF